MGKQLEWVKLSTLNVWWKSRARNKSFEGLKKELIEAVF
jgi:hypothetical protein